MSPMLPILWLRARYALWALQYVPPLIDGKFNPEYQKLSDYVNDKRLKRYFEGEQK